MATDTALANSAAVTGGSGLHAIADGADFDRRVLATTGTVLVDFWAAWCGPCRRLLPALEELAPRYAGQVDFVKLDIEAHPEIYARYGVQGIPTLILLRGGAEVARIAGPNPVRLRGWLDEAVAGGE